MEGTTATLSRTCEICGSAESRLLTAFTTPEWPLVACSGCGFVYLASVPAYAALFEEYAWERTSAATRKRRVKTPLGWISAATRWRMKLVPLRDRGRRDRLAGISGNVLDIGCSRACLIPPGPTPFGIEISRHLAEQARPQFERRGGRVINAPALEGLDAFDDGFFSVMLMRSYLEHESRPRQVLGKAYCKLAAGGRIHVRVPNFDGINRRIMGARWCGFRFPDHVNYFGGKPLRRLAEQIGFLYRRVNWHSIFDDNLIVELQKPGILPVLPAN